MRAPLPRTILFLLALAPALAAQQPLLETQGAALGGQLGLTVAGDGDVNHDGRGDLIFAAPMDSTSGTETGRVRVISGADGSTLYTLIGAAPYDQFGFAVAYVGDLDQDLHDDFAIGAPGADINGSGSGRVRIFSGKTGNVLMTLNGEAAGDTFGRAISKIGPADNVLHQHCFAVGAPNADEAAGTNAGAVYVYSWPSSQPLVKIPGAYAGEKLGWSLSAANVTGGLIRHVVAGAPEYSESSPQQGRVRILNPLTGAVFRTHVGTSGTRLGYSVTNCSELNNDGYDEYAAGAPYGATGLVRVYNGATGGVLASIPGGLNGSRFGWAICGRAWILGIPQWHMAIGDPFADSNGTDSGQVHLYRLNTSSATLAWTKNGAPGEQLGYSLGVTPGEPTVSSADVLAGAPSSDVTGQNSGRVRIYDAADTELPAIDGGAVGEQLGASVCAVGDVNGDGVPDYGVGAPHTWTSVAIGLLLSDVGSARICSGATGATLRYLAGTDAGDGLGTAVAGTGDVNGDGVPDWIAGAPFASSATTSGAGEAFVRSGAANATIFALDGYQTDSEFGRAVAAGDFNADGTPDFAVGMPGYQNGPNADAGWVRVYSGKNGTTVLANKNGIDVGDRFGSAVAMGDLNADGYSDLVIGLPGRDFPLVDQGQIHAYSGKTTGLLFSSTGTAANDALGSAVAVIGDVNLDGMLDVAAGAPFADAFVVQNAGHVRVLHGGTGAVLWSAIGGTNDFLGASIAPAGDVDLDGRPDVIVGAHEYAFILPSGNGYARVYSGATGTPIETALGTELAAGYGSAVAGIGDTNADGLPDAVIGSPYSGPNLPLVWKGHVQLVSLRPAGVSFYGASTPGCAGPQLLTASMVPKVNSPGFGLACNHAPANALGLLLIGNVGDFTGTNFLGLGVDFHVDLLASTFLVGIDMTSNAAGYGFGPAGIPNDPGLAGAGFFAQALWAETACTLPPFNLSATSAVAYAIQ